MSAGKDFVEAKLRQQWLEILPQPSPAPEAIVELLRLAAHHRRLEWVSRLIYLASQQPSSQQLLSECLGAAYKEGPSKRVLALFGPVPAPPEVELPHRVLMMRQEDVDLKSVSASQLKRLTSMAIRKRRQLLVSRCMTRATQLRIVIETIHLEWVVASCQYRIEKLDKVLKFISSHPGLGKRLAARLANLAIKSLTTNHPWLRYDASPKLARAWQDQCWLAAYMPASGPVDKQAVMEQVISHSDKPQPVIEHLLQTLPPKEFRRLNLGRLVGLCLEADRAGLGMLIFERHQDQLTAWVVFLYELLLAAETAEKAPERLVELLGPRRALLQPLEVALAIIGLTSELELRMRLLRLWFGVLRRLELGMHWRPLLRAFLCHPGFTSDHTVQRPRLTELVELLLPGLIKIDTLAWHNLCRLEAIPSNISTEEIIRLVGETLEQL